PASSTLPSYSWITRLGRNSLAVVQVPRRLASPATAWPVFSPASLDPPERESHELSRQCFFHPCRRDHGRHLPNQHSRSAKRRPRWLHVQSIPGSRCRAASVPHRPADAVRCGVRSYRSHHSGGVPPLYFVFARRGG